MTPPSLDPRHSRTRATALLLALAAAPAAAQTPTFLLSRGDYYNPPLLTSDANVVVMQRPGAEALDRFDLLGDAPNAYNDHVRKQIVQGGTPGNPIYYAISGDASVIVHSSIGSAGFTIRRPGWILSESVAIGGAIESVSMNRAGTHAFLKVNGSQRSLVRIDLNNTSVQTVVATLPHLDLLHPMTMPGLPPDRWVSDDARRAAFATGDGGLAMVTFGTGEAFTTTTLAPPSSGVIAAAVSRNGGHVYTYSTDSLPAPCAPITGEAAVHKLVMEYDPTSGLPSVDTCQLMAQSSVAADFNGFALASSGNVAYWSASGAWPAVATSSDLFMAHGNAILKLTNLPNGGAVHPRPDGGGQRVAYTQVLGNDQTVHLASHFLNTFPIEPLVPGEDPESPFDIVSVVAIGSSHCIARIRDDEGLGLPGSRLVWSGRSSGTQRPEFNEWIVQPFDTGARSAITFETSLDSGGGAFDTCVVRALGPGVHLNGSGVLGPDEQLDAREASVQW